ncbi:hypothetical protein C8J56DRAFT_1048984 [Mycena floridula]|nr:hypothetical protein C8J56DRAFT_1048984 [Mycena floridula]
MLKTEQGKGYQRPQGGPSKKLPFLSFEPSLSFSGSGVAACDIIRSGFYIIRAEIPTSFGLRFLHHSLRFSNHPFTLSSLVKCLARLMEEALVSSWTTEPFMALLSPFLNHFCMPRRKRSGK